MSPLVETDGNTVWVQNAQGDCLARFGRLGIDIHRSTAAQLAGESQCLFCTHERTTIEDWELFRQKVKHLHGIEVPEEAMPMRFTSSGKSK